MATQILSIVQRHDSDRRYVDMAEELYETLMPAIRKKMVQDGYEYFNVECIQTEPSYVYRYLYVKVR